MDCVKSLPPWDLADLKTAWAILFTSKGTTLESRFRMKATMNLSLQFVFGGLGYQTLCRVTERKSASGSKTVFAAGPSGPLLSDLRRQPRRPDFGSGTAKECLNGPAGRTA
jgi:hypothetical protein